MSRYTMHELVEELSAMKLTNAELESLVLRHKDSALPLSQRIAEAAGWLVAQRRIDGGAG